MKKFFAFLVLATLTAVFAPIDADAQIVKNLTISAADDTLTNADEATVVLSLDGSVKSVEALVNKISGVVAGTAVLEGKSLDGGSWATVESFTLTDVASQYKIFAIPIPRTYAGYRLRISTTGTSVAVPKAYLLRYTGG